MIDATINIDPTISEFSKSVATCFNQPPIIRKILYIAVVIFLIIPNVVDRISNFSVKRNTPSKNTESAESSNLNL